MDENKQLRGSLKTMANFVSTGLGGFSNAIQLPQYDNALELVNRGDRALLLKLVQEKGGSVGSSSGSGSGHSSHFNGSYASSSTAHKTSGDVTASTTPPPAAAGTAATAEHTDRKRKSTDSSVTESAKNDRTAHPPAPKVPRTRSQNQRTARQELQKGNSSNDKQQEGTAPQQSSPVKSAVFVPSDNFGQTYPATSGGETQGRYTAQPESSSTPQIASSTLPQANEASRAADIFPSYLGAGGPLNSFDIFANGNASNPASGSITPSFGGFVKQEDSPPLPTYGDSSSAWMNAYTNLTPIGGNESFWSLTSSAMNNSNQASGPQQQPQQQSRTDTQDTRSPSSAYLSTWSSTAAQMLSSNGTLSTAFPSMPHQGMQPPLHGYA